MSTFPTFGGFTVHLIANLRAQNTFWATKKKKSYFQEQFYRDLLEWHFHQDNYPILHYSILHYEQHYPTINSSTELKHCSFNLNFHKYLQSNTSCHKLSVIWVSSLVYCKHLSCLIKSSNHRIRLKGKVFSLNCISSQVVLNTFSSYHLICMGVWVLMVAVFDLL